MLNRRQFLLAVALTGAAWSLPRSVAMQTWNAAHRGGSQLAPENTLAAFSKAIGLACDAIELDIHLTTDKDLVVIHDDTLQRTSHQPGVVGQMTLAQLQAADPSIPSLRQVLRLARGHCKILVEIKHPDHGPRYQGIEDILIRQLQEEHMLDQVVVISFEKESLKRIHQQQPQIQTGYLYGSPVNAADIQKELGVTFLCPQFRLASSQMIEEAHGLGLRVNAWTVNEEADMRRLLEAGCDCITGDRPDRLKEILGR